MDKHHPLLHLPQDTSSSSKVLMQGNCFCAFNNKRCCMRTPGGMLKNRLKNAFPRTTEGFFPSFLVGKRCHLMSWKLWRSCSLTFLSACYDHIQSPRQFAPHLLQPSFMVFVNWTCEHRLLRRYEAFHRALRVRTESLN